MEGEQARAFDGTDLLALAADLRTVLEAAPVDPACPLCGSASAAHYCPPREEAKRRLRDWAINWRPSARVGTPSPESQEEVEVLRRCVRVAFLDGETTDEEHGAAERFLDALAPASIEGQTRAEIETPPYANPVAASYSRRDLRPESPPESETTARVPDEECFGNWELRARVAEQSRDRLSEFVWDVAENCSDPGWSKQARELLDWPLSAHATETTRELGGEG